MATDRNLNGKVFMSESEAASEASEFFSLYYGGMFLCPFLCITCIKSFE